MYCRDRVFSHPQPNRRPRHRRVGGIILEFSETAYQAGRQESGKTAALYRRIVREARTTSVKEKHLPPST